MTSMGPLLLFICLIWVLPEAQGRSCMCATTSVNVRTCASSSCSIIGTAAKTECYDYLDESSGSWRKIQYKAEVGWSYLGTYWSGPQTCGGFCMNPVCSSNSDNELRGFDNQGYGHYGAPRGSDTHKGVDVKCTADDNIQAPFNGILFRQAKPYGSGVCCDDGVLFKGIGAWSDFEVKIFYVTAVSNSWNDTFAKGDTIATHIGMECGDCYSGTGMTDHVHLKFYEGTTIVDPTSFALCR